LVISDVRPTKFSITGGKIFILVIFEISFGFPFFNQRLNTEQGFDPCRVLIKNFSDSPF
jgi:hypothetical protein